MVCMVANSYQAKMKYLLLGSIVLCCVSCAGPAKQPTLTIRPSQTATRKATPTATPVAVASVAPTPIALPSSYALPDWMKNPETKILAALVTDSRVDYLHPFYSMDFYNTATDEKFNINIPENVSGFFWYDSMDFGFLDDDLKNLELIDLHTGQTSKNALAPESLRLWNLEHEHYSNGGARELSALEIIHDPASNGVLIEQTGYDWQNKSKSKLFSADWNPDHQDTLIIADTNSQQIFWKLKLPVGFYGTEFAWSPADENTLAFVQGQPTMSDFEMKAMTLTIIDVVTQKTLGTYEGDFGRIAWSPDGKKILYENNASRFSSYGVGFSDAPCILFIETGVKRCLRSIPRFVPDGFKVATTGGYQWSSDGQSIFYKYEYYYPSTKEYKGFGSLCIYSLLDAHINCPTKNLDILQEHTISYYTVSPDQQFIYFCYSDSSSLSDMAGDSNNVLIRIDGTGFFSWPGMLQDGGPTTCSGSLLWRPLP